MKEYKSYKNKNKNNIRTVWPATCNSIGKEIPTELLSCELCDLFKRRTKYRVCSSHTTMSDCRSQPLTKLKSIMKIYSDWYSRHRFIFKFRFVVSCLFPSQPTIKTTTYTKNLCLHSKAINMLLKVNSYMTLLCPCCPVNLPTPTFGNINLTETLTNLIVA